MHKLKLLGAVAAVTMMAGTLAPDSAQATIAAYADFESSNQRITDSAGNKLDSGFFSEFGSTVTWDPRAVLRGVTDDPSNVTAFDKPSFEAGTGDFGLVQETASVFNNPNDFASGTASTQGNIINRAGENNANSTVTTTAEVNLDDAGLGSGDSQVLLQVFNFVIDPAAAGVEQGETVNLRFSFDSSLQLVTEDQDLTDDLFGTSPWSATSSFALSAVDETGQEIDATQIVGDLADLNRSRALGAAFGPEATTHTVEFAFTAGVPQQFSADQQVRVRANAVRDEPDNDIPVPATLMLFGTGLLGLGFVSRQRARRRQRVV